MESSFHDSLSILSSHSSWHPTSSVSPLTISVFQPLMMRMMKTIRQIMRISIYLLDKRVLAIVLSALHVLNCLSPLEWSGFVLLFFSSFSTFLSKVSLKLCICIAWQSFWLYIFKSFFILSNCYRYSLSQKTQTEQYC